MKAIKTLLAGFMLFAVVTAVQAQKMKVLSGDFGFLEGQEQVNVTMDFSKVTFYNENLSEQEYIDRRVKEIDEKEPGESANWVQDWKSFRNERFLDKFTTIASENSKKAQLEFSSDVDAPFTLIVKPTWIYPGWFGGVMKQPAKVSIQLDFVETANPSNVVLSIQSEKALGDIAFVGVPNTNDRIAEGFAKTGKSLAQLIDKKR
ncbi:hypothetical protein [Parapedobacter indicus]|uniref:DUF4136 domain-containing protein n=1 Tax=Parapedobacter indicus TaxID=1477437 RepID=A0A1I3HE35_9SPHI|nr:hypothetical protein [Parapedobacter indicus]PPL03002.1 hypothetical protein CLV26_103328 [Parapedobacter indicus]SFI34038.1 hypothetical protein SAMN05444682_103327 [Parapedobacter indicus]